MTSKTGILFVIETRYADACRLKPAGRASETRTMLAEREPFLNRDPNSDILTQQNEQRRRC